MDADQHPAPPAFQLVEPSQPRGPLVVASPHSGQYYPPDLLNAALLDARALRTSEDCFVDELFGGAAALGIPLLRAHYARAYLDLNREAYELDPAMFADRLPDFVNSTSPRVAVGLGTVARVVALGRPIYNRKLVFSEAERRIKQLHRPYHQALERLVRATSDRIGYCILIDAHSMPSPAQSSGGHGAAERQPDIVLGDRMGSSCHPIIAATAESALRDMGYVVTRNVPYAGGFTTRQYGLPDEGRHCLQIELNRALYMEEAALEKRPGFAGVAGDMMRLLAALKAIPGNLLQRQSLAAAQ